MSWFDRLTGFPEESPDQVRANLELEGDVLCSKANGQSWKCGRLETPSLAELRERSSGLLDRGEASTITETVANVQDLHRDPANAGAIFQVASQFNLLEMVGPGVAPEDGVGRYEHDFTQGPACAIACGAGTIYRNYFAPVGEMIGQTEGEQIDCLDDLGAALGNLDGRLWEMRNGYALATHAGLREISSQLEAADEEQLEKLRGLLGVGIQWASEVTLEGAGHLVSQVYGSALPVAYSEWGADLWEPFARLVLEASYEATVRAAAIQQEQAGEGPPVFLTLLGGGAFGNRTEWIVESVKRALDLGAGAGLDIRFVSYGSAAPELRPLLSSA